MLFRRRLLSRRARKYLIAKGCERHECIRRSWLRARLTYTDPYVSARLVLYRPDGGGVWLISDIHPEDHDLAYGLRCLAEGMPELCYFRLSELAAQHPGVRRARGFYAHKTMRTYAAALCQGLITPGDIRLEHRIPAGAPLH
jgi:hypothetical protein